MSETQNLLVDSAQRIFADLCDKNSLDSAEQGIFPNSIWQAIVDNGFHELAMSSSELPLSDVFAVIRVAGQHALPLPLAEVVLANQWLQASDRLVSIGVDPIGIRHGEQVPSVASNNVSDVPWGRGCQGVISVTQNTDEVRYFAVKANLCVVGTNLAGEARDSFSELESAATIKVDQPYAQLALSRVVLMTGAMERILELCISYATEREQFGRPISKFQAIQHTLAVLSGEVAAALRASDAAVEAIGTARFIAELAAAKSRVGEAAGIIAESAHQVHGAMGFTYEHQLHHFTRRLWAWRDEYGTEADWQTVLGTELVSAGPDELWRFIATPN